MIFLQLVRFLPCSLCFARKKESPSPVAEGFSVYEVGDRLLLQNLALSGGVVGEDNAVDVETVVE